ncbi:hypothetical protein MPEAHAMD_5121 [Methylobacterium frigidaeris]|uniref:Uncharacterized protein n=1 Tax=Methylobacterium frigidaeris TaxID=2038277 RepID=A0AA37HGV5_9HYPH|nr:hypothetical protein MPEAHAMD_5121 [Methylobacterium frigidaeris]
MPPCCATSHVGHGPIGLIARRAAEGGKESVGLSDILVARGELGRSARQHVEALEIGLQGIDVGDGTDVPLARQASIRSMTVAKKLS